MTREPVFPSPRFLQPQARPPQSGCERRRRRNLLTLVVATAAGGMISTPSQAFLGVFLRLIFGFGLRGGGRMLGGAMLRGGAANLASGGIARGLASAASRATIRQGVMAGGASARAAAAGSGTRLSQVMKPARQVTKGASAGAASSSGAALPIDLAMLAHDAHALLNGGAWPESVVAPPQLDLLQVELEGLNESSQHVNGVLSLLLFDDDFASRGEGRFFRLVLGVVSPQPGASIQFAHEFDLTDWGAGRLLIAPTLTTLAADATDRSIVFDPPIHIVDLQGG